MIRDLTERLRRLMPPGVRPLVLFLAVSAILLFVHLVDEMLEGDAAAPDRAILLLFRTPGDLARPIGPAWLQQSMIDISALGGFTFIWLFTIATLIFLVLVKHWKAAAIFFAGVAGASALNAVFKLSFHRARPDVVPHLTNVDSLSFPSGHAMISAATYMTVGALLAHMQRSRLARAYLMTVFITLAILIGISRIYLGVHWPSDVLAGWLLGAAWALLFWIVARRAEGDQPLTPDA
ncbi:MAG: phosphatase PAP2 family protein [Pseudomonadota bacterium]|nr:phosphatase PAP2 family protein [Pseudomonadota bacterium]